MGLLERLKLNKTKDFFEWLDLILKNELNSEIKAINFNLYEVILSILVDTFISKISFPMQPGPEIGSISDA